jgi:predicted metal-dependent peptidase
MLQLSDPLTEADRRALDRELDRTKTKVFVNKNAAFLGSLMCSMEFEWTREIPTADVTSLKMRINPDFFLGLLPNVRESVIVHELWHPGFLHSVRRMDRDHDDWNVSCDHKINLDMQDEGYSWEGLENYICLDRRFKGMVEEDIFETVHKEKPNRPDQWTGDLGPSDGPPDINVINAVVRAYQEAEIAGQAGNLPGSVKVTIDKFLKPVIRWEPIFHRFFTDLVRGGSTWRRPNRRFPDMYLPSRYVERDRLAHLNYYEDVSGSIDDADNLRFNSELKYVWDTLKPKRMDVMQFDTVIQSTRTLKAGDSYERVEIVGRGGTWLKPVRQHIIDTRPTAAVIFSDLECEPMAPLPFDVPVIWVAVRNHRATVPFGQLIHIR